VKVLVTGASGFVGSNLVHVLRERCDVLAPSHGSEHIDRVSLARRAVAAYGLGETLLKVGAPPPQRERIPYDTRLDAAETARRLDVELPTVDTLLEGLAWAST
jgi:uncharacterized protein YbjT (DUF2867 family)